MPGKASTPSFHALFDGLRTRVGNLEAWQRQTRGIPAGTITGWGGPGVPQGALACDGSTFSSATYPALAAAIGGTTLPNEPGNIIWT